MIELRPATLETVRPLRLRALREDPDAFGSTFERERVRPDAEWDIWVHGTLIACEDGTPVGMANLKLATDSAEIFGVWVAPDARGRGVGEALVRALLDRAGSRPVKVCVAETAPAARRLYERLGFRATGATGALRPASAVRTADLYRSAGTTRPPGPSRRARSR